MKNKYKYGELVIANGKGQSSNKQLKGLAFVKEKDYDYNQYLVDLLSDNNEEWFAEKDLERVLERKNKKMDKYKIAIAIDKRGLDIIENNLKQIPNLDKKNNKLFKVDFYKEYKVGRKQYAILVWISTYWGETNSSVQCIQNTLEKLRELDIAYQQIIIGETDVTYIKINEFIDNDDNVNIFEIMPKIKIKNIGGILI